MKQTNRQICLISNTFSNSDVIKIYTKIEKSFGLNSVFTTRICVISRYRLDADLELTFLQIENNESLAQ